MQLARGRTCEAGAVLLHVQGVMLAPFPFSSTEHRRPAPLRGVVRSGLAVVVRVGVHARAILRVVGGVRPVAHVVDTLVLGERVLLAYDEATSTHAVLQELRLVDQEGQRAFRFANHDVEYICGFNSCKHVGRDLQIRQAGLVFQLQKALNFDDAR